MAKHAILSIRYLIEECYQPIRLDVHGLSRFCPTIAPSPGSYLNPMRCAMSYAKL